MRFSCYGRQCKLRHQGFESLSTNFDCYGLIRLELIIFGDFDELSTAAQERKSAHEMKVMCMWDFHHRMRIRRKAQTQDFPELELPR